jgi:GNAT superfamily N-acetyltransferase
LTVSFEFVRDFRPAVVRAVLKLGKPAHEESAHSHLALDPGFLLDNAELFTHLDNHCFWLAWEGDEAVGVFAGKANPYFFSRDMVAVDSLWYVVPEKRGSRVGLQLLGLFEQWAEALGVVDIRIGQTTMLDPRVFNGILSSRGYDCVGSYFVRKVDHV